MRKVLVNNPVIDEVIRHMRELWERAGAVA
jgi:hypothetical protein